MGLYPFNPLDDESSHLKILYRRLSYFVPISESTLRVFYYVMYLEIKVNELLQLGYENGDNGVDSYGVDHSGFSTQDELQYQTARTNREQQLADDLQQQGIAEKNYPQYGLRYYL